MTNNNVGPSFVTTQNIVPIGAEFDENGNCLGLVGPAGEFFLPPGVNQLDVHDNTSDPATYYLTITQATEGIIKFLDVSSTKLKYIPSTGQLRSTSFLATGSVSGASGTFTGAISAASATITNALSAASGTFTGNVTATSFIGSGASLTGVVTSVTAGTGLSNTGTATAPILQNTGVVQALAGTGISVSSATGSVTFANTGVTELLAGSGIGVSAGTGSSTLTNTGVLSVSGGTTGLTPATATTGAVVLAGVLNLVNGGTGANNAASARTNLGLGSGLSVTIATAKLTTGGTDGSMTFVNGILTAQVAAT